MGKSYKPRPRVFRPIRIEGEVAYVPLTRGQQALIDAADVWLVEGRNWTYRPGPRTGYAYTQAGAMHRLIIAAPDGFHVDHINGDGLDNRRSNLRLASPSQNCQNIGKRQTNKSGFKGVCKASCGNKWRAQIRSPDKSVGSNGKVHLGTFDTPEQAYAAYCEANKRLHGEYGKL